MSTLISKIDSSGQRFQNNWTAYQKLQDEISQARGEAIAGGKKRTQSQQKNGALLPRERINKLLDPGSPFLEIGQVVGHEVYDQQVPSAGIVTGIGMVAGNLTAIYANDPSVDMGQTWVKSLLDSYKLVGLLAQVYFRSWLFLKVVF